MLVARQDVPNGGSVRFARDEGRSRTVTRSVRLREPERRSERLRAAPTAEGGRAQVVPNLVRSRFAARRL